MNCIIIDDDQSCIVTLEALIKKYCSEINVLASSNTIVNGVDMINQHKPDVVFLDVELNNEMGFDLFTYFPSPSFRVVFTTAHAKYAIKAIKSSCFDYLLKPIEVKELLSTVDRLQRELKNEVSSSQVSTLIQNYNQKGAGIKKIAIASLEGFSFVSLADIICLQADARYTTIYLQNNSKIVSSKNIGEYDELLEAPLFFRTHKSWIINLDYIVKFNRHESQIKLANGMFADLSTRRKDEFLKLFDKI